MEFRIKESKTGMFLPERKLFWLFWIPVPDMITSFGEFYDTDGYVTKEEAETKIKLYKAYRERKEKIHEAN